jgi:hypothetical protein
LGERKFAELDADLWRLAGMKRRRRKQTGSEIAKCTLIRELGGISEIRNLGEGGAVSNSVESLVGAVAALERDANTAARHRHN